LKSIVIPEGVTEIGAEAFLSCGDDGKGLSEVVLPSTVKVIGANAFATNHALKSVTLNEGLEEIGTEAFYGTLLATENLTIPSTVTAIGNSAFEGTNISGKLTIPDSVTNIGSNAFAYCSYLTEVDVGTGLTTIQNFTFGGCAGLKTINLPANITKIGSGAFAIVEESTGNTEFTINYAGKADVWESMVDLSKTQSSLVIQLIAEFGSFEAGAKLILGDSYTDEAASKLYEDLSTGKGGYAYNYLIPDCPLYYALQDTLTAQTINVVCGYNAETKTGDTTITYTWNSETNTYDVTTETKTTD
jgi:hypothetical protein